MQYGDNGEEEASLRAFTEELKADIVERCLKGDRSVAQVAHDFDLTVSAVRGWVKHAEIGQGRKPGTTTLEQERIAPAAVTGRPESGPPRM